jgi:hypothetical protein
MEPFIAEGFWASENTFVGIQEVLPFGIWLTSDNLTSTSGGFASVGNSIQEGEYLAMFGGGAVWQVFPLPLMPDTRSGDAIAFPTSGQIFPLGL